MILVASNVPMYLVGAAHPHTSDAHRLVEAAILAEERLVTSAEVLQEILHRYIAINRRGGIQPAFDVLLGVVDEVLPVTVGDVALARDIALSERWLSAREAVHVVMERAGISRIMSLIASSGSQAGITRPACDARTAIQPKRPIDETPRRDG
jgi:predicted nucleic acid-binding protein